MPTLVLLRHGQSFWNKANLFTGWTDVDLTELGMEEARRAGARMAAAGYSFDRCFTSLLKRAIKTLHAALEEMGVLWLPEEKSWRLNERALWCLARSRQGGDCRALWKRTGLAWRRSWDVRPPPLDLDDERHPVNDGRYADLPTALRPGRKA